MDINEAMQFASNQTHVFRARKNTLYTFGATRLPYVCLSDAPETADEVMVRMGEVTAERPQISLPGSEHAFEGFDFGEDEVGDVMRILLSRRVEIPPAKYVNTAGRVLTERGPVEAAAERAMNRLESDNDSRTAVIGAPESVWNLSVLLYVGAQVIRSAPANIAEHLERLNRQGLL